MAENFYGLIPTEEWLDVGFQVTRPNDPLDQLIDDIRVDSILAKWEYIAAEYQTSVMAQFHAFDTEANTTIRIPVDSKNVKKGLIKVKINQSEQLQEYKDKGVREDALYDYVLNDGIRLADQVFTRSKVAKAEMLATGKVTIHENNLDLSVDYGVPASQTAFTLNLSPDADISSQLQAIIDAADDAGVTLTGMITSRKNITKMRKNKMLQKEINGALNEGVLIGQAALQAHLESEYGISRIVIDDLTYGKSIGLGADGRPVIQKARYFPENTISFFTSNPMGRVGSGLWGDPPEVNLNGFYPVNASGEAPYVYVTQKQEWDPAVLWTKASGLFMPVLFHPNSLWIANVTDGAAPTLGSLTVSSAAGTASGTTKLTVSPAKASGNVYKYKAGEAAVNVTYGQNVQTWTAWDGASDITADTGKIITLVEADSDYKAVASGTATVTAKA